MVPCARTRTTCAFDLPAPLARLRPPPPRPPFPSLPSCLPSAITESLTAGVPVRFGRKEDGKWTDSGGVWEAKIADAPEKLAGESSAQIKI